MATIPVSLFQDATTSAPTEAAVSWPEDFLNHTEVSSKAAQKVEPLWSPATYKTGTTRRLATLVEKVHALVLDFDHDADIERAAMTWRDFEFVLYTSLQHSPEAPRFRIVLPLETPITPTEHTALWAAAKVRSPEIDPACKDACRIYYGPQHLPGVAPLAMHWKGTTRLSAPSVTSPVRPAPSASGSVFAGIERPRPLAQVENIDSIEGACAFMRQARDEAADLSEPEWYAAMSIWARCKDGDNIAHARSSEHPGYTRVEAQAKLERAKAVGPSTCAHIRGLTPACVGCTMVVTSPVSLGRGPVGETGGSVVGPVPPGITGDVIQPAPAPTEDDVERIRAWDTAARDREMHARAQLEMAKHALRRARAYATDDEVQRLVAERAVAELALREAKDEVAKAARALKKIINRVDADAPAGADAEVWTRLDLSPQDQRPRPTKGNVQVVFTADSRYAGALTFNEFAAVMHLDGKPTRDEAITRVAIDLEYRYQLVVPTNIAGEVAMSTALDNSYHPVRDYLAGLQHDDTPRVHDLLLRGFGAVPGEEGDDAAWFADMAKRFMVSCVARVMEPGCKVDTMLILTGDQGVGKSMGLRTLASPPAAADTGGWFADSPVAIGEKDGAMQLRGNWIYELGEMDSFKKADASRVKLWLTSQEDNVRLPYGKNVVKMPRETVICGTTNQDTFLNDPTGARRFLIVRVSVVDVEWIRDNRDQLWAEALALYQSGFQWWYDKEGVAKLSRLNEAFREHDLWEDLVRNVVAQRKLEKVTILGLAVDVLRKEPGDVTRADRMRLADVLRSLGCTRERECDGSRAYFFRVPPGLYSSANAPHLAPAPTVLPFSRSAP